MKDKRNNDLFTGKQGIMIGIIGSLVSIALFSFLLFLTRSADGEGKFLKVMVSILIVMNVGIFFVSMNKLKKWNEANGR